MESLQIRMDKWLWMVRLFKTRSVATDACNAGKVKLNGVATKPSKNVKIGEVLEVNTGTIHKTVKVIAAPKSRISAPLVPDFLEDLTPAEEYERVKATRTKFEFRDHGEGRPTKRDRRQIEYLKNYYPH
ncbi:MAG: RNA-binding S4 domain-containing protein [Bacteroidales bacterium]|jgi:ribosome-associated heat shock protein Hsp15|nr:RNA-binding S4 domain-containing protein [Bacteroidales bacterium]